MVVTASLNSVLLALTVILSSRGAKRRSDLSHGLDFVHFITTTSGATRRHCAAVSRDCFAPLRFARSDSCCVITRRGEALHGVVTVLLYSAYRGNSSVIARSEATKRFLAWTGFCSLYHYNKRSNEATLCSSVKGLLRFTAFRSQ